ncbi:MAG: hypothetical protein KF830_01015 [Planctomycetes bacterium]|nr:hypothetical protein [Planctomycetota bacterium]
MRSVFVIGRLLAALAVAPLAAQVAPGDQAPAAAWRTWIQGEPVVLGDDARPRCAVFVFCTRRPAAAHEDADYLRLLQQRFADRGGVVVAVVAEVPERRAELQQAWAGCRIAVDQGLATSVAWLGRESAPGHLVVLDRQGVVRFVGLAEAGLVDAVERTLAGTQVPAAERAAAGQRLEARHGFDDAEAEALVAQCEALVAHAPRDGLAQGLLYAALATRLGSPLRALRARDAAIPLLAAEPRPLAAFADVALRSDPHDQALARALAAPLAAAAAAAPGDPVVQLAHLRALVRVGDSREVGRRAMRLQKHLHAADRCLDFVAVLAGDAEAAVHRDLAGRLLERAEQSGADARDLAAARYAVARRCLEDAAAARRVLDAYLQGTDEGSINNDCWYLMTDLRTMGRCDWFAAGLAERMLERQESMQSHEFDTAALALFLVGRAAEAVALQERAIALGGNSPDYQQRLRRYQAAIPAAPK